MRPSSTLLVTLCLVGCASTVREPVIAPDAAPTSLPATLLHADCARLATLHAPTAAAWEARLQTARIAVRQAGKPSNPTLSLSWESLGLGASSIQRTLSISQALATLAAAPRTRAAAAHDLAATQADLIAERRRLVAAAWRAYDDLVAARSRVRLATEVEALLEEAARAAAKRATAGEGTRREQELAEAEVAKARGDRAAAEGEARAQEIALCAALGTERPVPLRLGEGLADLPSRTPDEIAAAVRERAEVRAAGERYAARLERARLAAAGYRFIPSPTAGARREGDVASAIVSWDIEFPVFDSGRLEGQAAEAELLAAAAELRNTARAGAFQAAGLFERDLTAHATRDDHARPLAKRRHGLRLSAERLHDAGELEFDALVAARRDEVEAGAALLDAEAAAARSRLDLWEAAGLLDVDAAPPR